LPLNLQRRGFTLNNPLPLLIFFGLLLTVLPAAWSAEDQQPSVFLVTDRPTNSASPLLVPKGSFQLEAGYVYSRLDTDFAEIEQHAAPDLLIRFGISDRVEGRLFTTGWVIRETDDNSSTKFSDVTVGTKIGLLPKRGRVDKISLLADVSLPVGSEGETGDYVVPKVLLIGGYELSDRFGLTCNIGPSWVTYKQNGERERSWNLNYALAFSALVRPEVTLFTEVYGDLREGDLLPDQHNLQAGATIQVAPKFQLDFRFGAGLVSAAPDWFLGAGLAFRLP